MLELEKQSKQYGTTDASITNRIQELEDRISDREDKLEEINPSSKILSPTNPSHNISRKNATPGKEQT